MCKGVCFLLVIAVVVGAHPARLDLAAGERESIAVKKATCPFIGSIVKSGALDVYGTKASPLAKVDDVRRLGNTGPGGHHFGDVLFVFAQGNHAKTRSSPSSRRLDEEVPPGFFSLDFGGSQGAHPGDSKILLRDWRKIDAGFFNAQAFQRLLSFATKDVIKRSDVGRFIAHNLKRDPHSKVASTGLFKSVLGDTTKLLLQITRAARAHIHKRADAADVDRASLIALTKTLGEENLVGSSGEFGLLFAVLTNSPRTREVGGEIGVSVADVRSMFVDHEMPTGWEHWEKRSRDWLVHSSLIAYHAAKEYRK